MNRPADATIPEARSLAFLFHGQLLHAVLLVLLVVVAYALAAPGIDGVGFGSGDGTVLGLTVTGWFWLNIILVVVHQALVALVFRLQLGWGLLTKAFGRLDLAAWGAAFLPLLIGRPLVLGCLAAADAGSMALPRALTVALGWTLLVPVAYALWSVARYFGTARGIGGDHFRVEYREMPLVRRGAFSWTPNAIYLIVFLGLWGIAFLYGSRVALVGALFQHAYIWVHYWCTERPDMDLIYGQ